MSDAQFVSASERFECVGSLYYQRHGRLRPGKSEPLETGRDANSDENREQFETWFAVHAFTDAINRIVRLERELERLSKPLHEREPPHCPSCSCGMEAELLKAAENFMKELSAPGESEMEK